MKPLNRSTACCKHVLPVVAKPPFFPLYGGKLPWSRAHLSQTFCQEPIYCQNLLCIRSALAAQAMGHAQDLPGLHQLQCGGHMCPRCGDVYNMRIITPCTKKSIALQEFEKLCSASPADLSN